MVARKKLFFQINEITSTVHCVIRKSVYMFRHPCAAMSEIKNAALDKK